MLRVVTGDATPEEIAAVVAAVAASSTSEDVVRGPSTSSVWAARGYGHRNLRAAFTPGPDSWRTSFWPR